MIERGRERLAGPRIAVTMGDPAGIGPEIILKAAHTMKGRIARGDFSLVVLGSAATHRGIAADLGLADPFTHLDVGDVAANAEALVFADVSRDGSRVPIGRTTAVAGQVAYDAIAQAVTLSMDGITDAICTGPISKEALNLAGHHYNGHTELLADLTKARDSVMLLAHGNLRVSHMTTHSALQDVPGKITPARLRRVVTLTDEALRALEQPRRRISIAAQNPNAGEVGLFGRKEIYIV